MPLQKLPTTGLDDPNHRRRAREVINQVLDHSFDDSRAQTAAEKLAGVTPIHPAYPPGDVRRYGVVADDTDRTDEIVAVFTALGATYNGPLYIPPQMRFDMMSVVDAVPNKAVLYYNNVFQSGSGYRQQIWGTVSNPPDDGTDTTFVIFDPHYAGMSFNNPRLLATNSSVAGLAGFSWDRGFFDPAISTGGPRVIAQQNFTKSPVRSGGVWAYTLTVRAPEVVGNYEAWVTGWAVTSGQHCLSPANNFFYRAQTSGTTGATAPTGTAASVSDGAVDWAFVSQKTSGTVFYNDEDGRIGTKACGTGKTHNWEQGIEDAEDFNVFYTASGISKVIAFTFQPTDSGGSVSSMPQFVFQHGFGLRIVANGLARNLINISNTKVTLDNTQLVSETAANLASKTNAINTADKFAGKMVRDSTNNRVLIARGATDVDTWDNIATGAAVITPV